MTWRLLLLAALGLGATAFTTGYIQDDEDRQGAALGHLPRPRRWLPLSTVPSTTSPAPPPATTARLQCSGDTIPKYCADGTTFVCFCDTITECPDGEDENEENCGKVCPVGQMLCEGEQTCIYIKQVCDGSQDCGNSWDELDSTCATNTTTPIPTTTTPVPTTTPVTTTTPIPPTTTTTTPVPTTTTPIPTTTTPVPTTTPVTTTTPIPPTTTTTPVPTTTPIPTTTTPVPTTTPVTTTTPIPPTTTTTPVPTTTPVTTTTTPVTTTTTTSIPPTTTTTSPTTTTTTTTPVSSTTSPAPLTTTTARLHCTGDSTPKHCADGRTLACFCDSIQQCPDGEDEKEENCPTECPPQEQPCKDGLTCVHEDQICDGKYNCPNGSDEENCPQVILRPEPPQIEINPVVNSTVVGGSVHFQCRSTAGIPSPTMQWTRTDGWPIPSNAEMHGGQLRFNQVRGDEKGSYLCTAWNNAGYASAVATLDIRCPPTISIHPGPSPYTVKTGESVRLECLAEGSPTPSVYWRRLRIFPLEPLRVSRSCTQVAVYEITRVSKADEGTYQCLARNSEGRSNKTLQLLVQDDNIQTKQRTRNSGSKEAVLTATDPIMMLYVGQTAELRCETSGINPNDVRWSRVGGWLPPGAQAQGNGLRIHWISLQDSGYYQCEATTPSGRHLYDVIMLIVTPNPHYHPEFIL